MKTKLEEFLDWALKTSFDVSDPDQCDPQKHGHSKHAQRDDDGFVNVVPEVFTPEQVYNLWQYQFGPTNSIFDARHPYTCPNRGDGKHFESCADLGALVPTVRGWICPSCDYRQDGAGDLLKDWKPGQTKEFRRNMNDDT